MQEAGPWGSHQSKLACEKLYIFLKKQVSSESPCDWHPWRAENVVP